MKVIRSRGFGLTAFWCLGAWALVVVGCGDSGGPDLDAGDADALEGTEGVDGDGDARDDGRADDGADGDGDGDADGDADDGTDVPPGCGDGILDPGEDCDDGALNSDTEPDACRTDCTEARCGDGVADTGEACDDGNDIDTDECRNDCSPPTCGNGTVEREWGEECDDANDIDTDDCLSTCVGASCGDGFVWDGHEDCDGETSEACTTACGSTGARGCVGCALTAECVPPAEVCNGLDDDCVGGADDGFPCVAGSPVSCTTDCGSTGTGTCSGACDVPAGPACLAPVEVCNGFDDDCVGGADDGFPCVAGASVTCTTDCGTAGTGTCSDSCELPAGAGCAGPAEVCNGLDDDCVGGPDDTFPCVAGASVSCSTTCGSTGSGTCSGSCVLPDPASCTPPAEVCNGSDDDCASGCDNGFACCAGTSVSCTTTCGSTGSGTCTSTCTAPLPAACTPPAETCNGADDDCESGCDNGFACCAGAPVSCTTTCGSTGTGACSASCALPGATACTPPAETCNGLDDDCASGCDNGFACCLGATQPCTVGVCSGTQACAAGCTWGSCGFGAPPADDSCSGTLRTIPETAGSYVFTGSTCAANNDYNYMCSAVTAASADVVFRLSITTGRKQIVMDTVGTGFDAMLFLRSGGSCPGSTLTCDDNTAGGGQARITTTLDPGTYWIVFDGAGAGNRGSYVLNVVVADIIGPANDACAGAVRLAMGPTLRQVAGDTTAALDDNASCAGTGGRDVWYFFELPVPHAVYLDTQDGRTWDSVIHVRSGSCSGSLTSIGCADDQCGSSGYPRSQFVGILPAGTYYVAIDGFSSTSFGAFTLSYQASTCVAAADANPLTVGVDPIRAAGGYYGSTVGRGDDSTGTCVAGPMQVAPDVYYFGGVCPGRTITASTCTSATDFDTVLYVRQGQCGPTGSPDTICNNNCGTACPIGTPGTSCVTFGSGGQGLYYLWVDGYTSMFGFDEGNYGVGITGW